MANDWLTGSQLPTERRHEVNIRRVCMVGAVWQVDGPSSKSVSPPRVYKMAPRIEPRWHQVQVYIARMRCLGADVARESLNWEVHMRAAQDPYPAS